MPETSSHELNAIIDGIAIANARSLRALQETALLRDTVFAVAVIFAALHFSRKSGGA